jgi:putative transposase
MEAGQIYHVYNHANGFENLFNDEEDYQSFLKRIVKFTSPVANYFSYCLMPNHFHLLLEIKTIEEIKKTMLGTQVEKKISRSFANAFSGFSKKMNKKYDRMGSLFNQNMKSRQVNDEIDFCSTSMYIHANPVHHGFVNNMDEWMHSSYNLILENSDTWIDIAGVLDYFGNIHEFIKYHKQPIELKVKEKGYF